MMPFEPPLKESPADKYAAAIADRFGPNAPRILALLRSLPDPEGSARELALGDSGGVEAVCAQAPALLKRLEGRPEWIKAFFRGEPLPVARPIALAVDSLPRAVADSYLGSQLAILLGWVGDGGELPSTALCGLAEELIAHIHRRLQLSFSIIALGSLATTDLAPTSDLDLLLVAENRDLPRNELETHALLGFFQGLRHYELQNELDIQRIHGNLFMPQGGLSGLAISTLTPAEFAALSVSRPLIGNPERTVEPTPLTPERLKSLVAHKKRIETELVSPRYRRRNVKLGEGGLSDIEWMLMLHEARYPTATDRVRLLPLGPGEAPRWRTEDRIRNLASAQLLTPMESEELLTAHRHLAEVRLRLYLLDLTPDVIPENPDKLHRLANAMAIEDGNDFLRLHEQHIDTVRAIYLDSLERLRA
jgi:hypothetical protein